MRDDNRPTPRAVTDPAVTDPAALRAVHNAAWEAIEEAVALESAAAVDPDRRGSGRPGPARPGTAGRDRRGPHQPGAAAGDGDGDEEVVPTFSEQLAQQLGGVRGIVESSIPILVFVIVNFWALKPAMIIASASAVLIAVYRLLRRQTVRHAVNGLFGVGIGVFFAWRSGSAKDFYLPGIILSFVYGLAMLASVIIRRPVVGWIWSLLVAGGSTAWRNRPPMVRLFSRLTVLWAVTYLAKVVFQAWLFHNTAADDPGTALGIARLALGYPPYALLLAVTVWSVRRLMASDPSLADLRSPGAQPAGAR